MERLKEMSLRRAFFLLALGGLVAALGLALILWQGCGAVIARYPAGGFAIGPNGTFTLLPEASPDEARLRNLLEWARLGGCVLLPPLGLGAAGAVFYRWKLKEPIALLAEGVRRVQSQDLDFTLPETSGDELGRLVSAFETMRAGLLRSNRELWRQAEERKRLNAAFAHDLRNPITVLKGSVTLLRRGDRSPGTVDRLERYILRVEEYVEAMSGIQRLEQLPVRSAPVETAALAAELEETARALGPGLEVSVLTAGPETAVVDRGIFLTVAENLAGNGARFARSGLEISLGREGEVLTLAVGDDGPGFPEALLREGPKPFGRVAEEGEHFGMGLYICDLLCRKHGGELKLENRPGGGAIATATFRGIRG